MRDPQRTRLGSPAFSAESLSTDQTIARFQRKHVTRVGPPCCDVGVAACYNMLGVVDSNLKMDKFCMWMLHDVVVVW